MYFECRSVVCCEGDIVGDIEHRQNGSEFVTSLYLFSRLQESRSEVPEHLWCMFFSTWATIVSDYSQLELSEQSDRLHAIAGLANIAKLSIPGRYLSGIWEINLADGLLWNTAKSPMERAQGRFAPSWSWASSTREVNINGYAPEESLMKLVRVSEGANALERLHIRGRIQRCYVSLEPEPVETRRSDRKFLDPLVHQLLYSFLPLKDARMTPGESLANNICCFDG